MRTHLIRCNDKQSTNKVAEELYLACACNDIDADMKNMTVTIELCESDYHCDDPQRELDEIVDAYAVSSETL